MRYFKKDAPIISFTSSPTKIAVGGIVILFLSVVSTVLKIMLINIPSQPFIDVAIIKELIQKIALISKILLVVCIVTMVISLIVHLTLSDSVKICHMVKKRLFCYEFGNPLNLKEYERLPAVSCKSKVFGIFEVSIKATSCTIDDLTNASSSISSALSKGKFKKYAVTQTNSDVALNTVFFQIEDVTIDSSLVIDDVKELCPKKSTKLVVQKDTFIDLTTSGSILVAGKTRSGKTTGVLAILLQALLSGKDSYGSEITIIDPKQAELSRLPYTYTLDSNGEAKSILDAIRHFADTIVKRQKILNDLSEKKGDVVKWFDAGFHVSFLFIDEYVACRTMFPTKASKDDPDYCLATLDALIKKILTMGSSAGCFAIISIAQASVGEGGLPSMLRDAMSTKILFKPTLDEGRLIWDSNKLKDFPERVYNAGDAWFSSTDGIHDNVSYVHFPLMNFKVYRELGALLKAYYKTN